MVNAAGPEKESAKTGPAATLKGRRPSEGCKRWESSFVERKFLSG